VGFQPQTLGGTLTSTST